MKEAFKVIIELVIAILVMVAGISYGVSVGSGTNLLKGRTARDIALTIATIQASPGAVLFSYADVKGFIYDFEGNRVDVYSRDEDLTSPSSTFYFFPKDLGLTFAIPDYSIKPQPDQERTVLTFKKNYPTFSIDSSDITLDGINCENLDTSKDVKQFIIFVNSKDEDIQKGISNLLRPALESLGGGSESLKYASDKDELIKFAGENKEAIVIEISDLDFKEDGDVRILVKNTQRASRLGCIARNLLVREKKDVILQRNDFSEFENEVVIEIEVKYTSSEEKAKILQEVGQSLFEHFNLGENR